MKRSILCPADFTSYSSVVIQYASSLALAINADLLLYHSSYIPVEASGGGGQEEERKILAKEKKVKEELIAECESLKKKAKSKGKKINYEYIKEDAFNIGDIKNLVKEKNVSLIITGAPAMNNEIEHGVFSASNALSVLENSACPVLVLPLNGELPQIKKVLYSIDIDDFKFNTINNTLDLLKPFRPDVNFLYFTEEADSKEKIKFDAARTAILENIFYENTNFELLTASNLIKGLNEYADSSDADLVVMATYKKHLMERFEYKSHTKKMLQTLKVPVLIMKGQI